MDHAQIHYASIRDQTTTTDSPGESKVNNDNGSLLPQAFSDANIPTWRRIAYHSLVFIFGCLLLFVTPLMLFLTFFAKSATYPGPEQCTAQANGDSFFAPDTVYGNFTLAEAKAIDLAWNTVVGKGGTALIALGYYSIAADALLRIAEVTPISLDLFAHLVFQPTSFFSLRPLITEFFTLGSFTSWRSWRHKIAVSWLAVSVLGLLTLPVALDAMTGYVQRQDAIVRFDDGTIVDYDPRISGGQIQCVPGFGYQWGFSSSIILNTMSLSFMWIFGMFCIWLDAQWCSELRKKGRGLGVWRGVVDLAEAVEEQLGSSTGAYSDRRLKKALRKAKGVKYTVGEAAGRGGSLHIKLSAEPSARLRLLFDGKYA
ncbi:hypothetical protein DL98DRAFT_621979 [Cadophora sp. DSE1049]|nr:hypothetical protein DL98DRAFT_621979 [Cadophora sp. DSE1049]